jgi:ankyrin repeat protein
MRKTVLILAALSAVTLFAGTDIRLVDAVKNHDKDAVRSLLKEHLDVNTPEADGTSALHWAAHFNDLETVQLLLSPAPTPKP